MISNANEARAAIGRIGLPAIFQKITHRSTPIALVGTCEPVNVYYTLLRELVERIPLCQNYIPLWETNLEAVVAYDSSRNIFVRYYYGSESDEILGKTYQQFLSTILLELVDSGVWDELDELARLFEYKHVDRLRVFVESCDNDNFEQANRIFVASIPD